MDSQEPPPPLTLPPSPPPLLTSQNPPYFFTPSSVLPSSSLQPPLPLPDLDIDWISLLSGQPGSGFGDTMMINKEKLQSSCDRNEGGDDDKEERGGKRRLVGRMSKASRPRFAFQTRSADDILDDGYRWRKYGQKAVKNSTHPRSYYRCTHHTCNVKKQVQRLSKDTSIVVTTYEGIHNHPCEKLMETLTPLLKQMQFLSRF